jgi:hypothetical protein
MIMPAAIEHFDVTRVTAEVGLETNNRCPRFWGAFFADPLDAFIGQFESRRRIRWLWLRGTGERWGHGRARLALTVRLS